MLASALPSRIQWILLVSGSLAILICSAWRTQAQSVGLAWDPAFGGAGYYVYYGTMRQVYTQKIDIIVDEYK